MVISLPEQFLVGGAALESGQHTAGHYALPHLPHTEGSELFAQRSGVRFEWVCPQAGQAAVCLVGEDVPCFVRVVLVQEFCHIPPSRAQHHQALYVIPEHCRVQIIGTGAAQHSVDQTGCTGFFKGGRQRGPDTLPGAEHKGVAGTGRAQGRNKAEHRGNGDLSGRVFLPDGFLQPEASGNAQDLLHPPLCRKLEAEAQRGQPHFAAAAEEALLYMVLPSAWPDRGTAEKENLKTGAAARCCAAVLFCPACPLRAGMLY